MGNSNIGSSVRKPREDFPLFPHKTGRWAKKVRGKFAYFGKTEDDPDGVRALDLWLKQKDYLLAGRKPPTTDEKGLLIKDLLNRFLTAKKHQVDAGEVASRTWADYRHTTDRLVRVFGGNRLVTDLGTDDFEKLRADIAKTHGPVALGNEVQRVRVVFKYAFDAGLIEQQMRFGPHFKRPSQKTLRVARAKQGPKMFEAGELRRLLGKASLQLKVMMLLAINCGFGNNDCASLHIDAIDLDAGMIRFPRPKTGIDRRCPLWPETTKRIKRLLAKRKEPKDAAHAGLLFVTKRGGSFAKKTSDNPVAKEFAKLVKATGVPAGRGFYAIRHTFRTVADETRDFPACDLIMGHTDPSMASRYRERIDDERLKAVTDHVRKWLFAREKKGGE